MLLEAMAGLQANETTRVLQNVFRYAFAKSKDTKQTLRDSPDQRCRKEVRRLLIASFLKRLHEGLKYTEEAWALSQAAFVNADQP
jgi:hypothetical protein